MYRERGMKEESMNIASTDGWKDQMCSQKPCRRQQQQTQNRNPLNITGKYCHVVFRFSVLGMFWHHLALFKAVGVFWHHLAFFRAVGMFWYQLAFFEAVGVFWHHLAFFKAIGVFWHHLAFFSRPLGSYGTTLPFSRPLYIMAPPSLLLCRSILLPVHGTTELWSSSTRLDGVLTHKKQCAS